MQGGKRNRGEDFIFDDGSLIHSEMRRFSEVSEIIFLIGLTRNLIVYAYQALVGSNIAEGP